MCPDVLVGRRRRRKERENRKVIHGKDNICPFFIMVCTAILGCIAAQKKKENKKEMDRVCFLNAWKRAKGEGER